MLVRTQLAIDTMKFDKLGGRNIPEEVWAALQVIPFSVCHLRGQAAPDWLSCRPQPQKSSIVWQIVVEGFGLQVVRPACGYVSAPNSPSAHEAALGAFTKDDLHLPGVFLAHVCCSFTH